MDYGKHVSPLRGPPTTTHRADPRQQRNNSGGYVFVPSPVERLERFLVLGTEGGTYYQGEREFTVEHAVALRELLDVSPALAVRTIVDVSQWGRAPKQSPGIFALAVAASHQTGIDPALARSLALNAVPLVCRTGGTFLEFVRLVDGMRGWGTSLRRALGGWYARLPAEDLIWQTLKYRSRGAGKKGSEARNAWTHRDVLRKARPDNSLFDGAQQAAVRYLVGGALALDGRRITRRAGDWSPENDARETVRVEGSLGTLPEVIAAFEELQVAETEGKAAEIVERHRLAHEMVPDRYKKSKLVWEALLPNLPMGAMVRNLGLLTHLGLLDSEERSEKIVGRLGSIASIRRSRMHPIAFLTAARVYAHGEPVEAQKYARRKKKSGDLGKAREVLRWAAKPSIVQALEQSFYRAFVNVQPSGVRLDLCIDISGSMASGNVAGIPGMSPREAAAAMALVQAQSEERASFWGFCDTFRPLEIDKTWSIREAMSYMNGMPMDGTDISLPFREAEKSGRLVDGFAVYTDNETNQNREHPFLALQRYRKASGLPARLAVMAFTSSGFTIADPSDGGMMDFVGFDAAAPSILADFLRGKRVPRDAAEDVEREA
jgi:60 kDa SS-A/Ro ribonucleoprotein